MGKEELHLTPEEERARIKINLAYQICDVANSFILEAESVLGKRGKSLDKEEKRKWNNMIQQIRRSKACTKSVCHVMYHFEETETAIEEADNLQDLIWLITDRTGDDMDAFTRIRSMIYNSFKPILNVYE